MTSPWRISPGTDRIELNARREGQVTFTVTNPGPVDQRAVLEVLPGDNTRADWFVVDEPRRLIKHGGSATFLVHIKARPEAAPGPAWLAARVYPAEGAPEEHSTVSDRVAFDITGAAAKRISPLLWIVPVAVLALVVTGVLGWLFLGGEDPVPVPPTTTTTTTAAQPALMVDLTGQTEEQAGAILTGLGAAVGGVAHRHDPPNAGTVLEQSVPQGKQLQPGDTVNLVVAVALAPPALQAPSNGATFAASQGMPTVSWQPVPGAAGYRVQFESEVCAFIIFGIAPCIYSSEGKWGPPYTDYHARSFVEATTNSASPDFKLRIHDGVPRAGHSGDVRWQVFALDDFGNVGPPSGFFTFHVALRNPDEYGPLPS
ncbi:MAG TPA: PASTA domain-containing protein [Pseudonocardiaceae bacterium]|nr:PASTA domain-containing protein [Pseudonocardiaceae bacterium]